MSTIPTIAEASKAIETGKLSPVELMEDCLGRIAALDGQLHSVIHLVADEAREAAREAEADIAAGRRRGPLHGIPIGLKDIYDLAGTPTTAHSRRLLDNMKSEDAVSVAQLKAAGAIPVGKLATHEFALGGPSFDLPFPPARNPFDTERFTGGSSSGTAAAIAAGLVLGGTGSDTGGSIRVPAAYCGLTGLKPTYGLISRRGIFPLSWSLDHAGPMAWTVEDCALMLQAMAGHDPLDPASVKVETPDYAAALDGPLTGLRVGVIRHFHEVDNPSNADVLGGIAGVAEVLRSQGATIRDVTLSPLGDYAACGHLIMLAEGFAIHRKDLAEQPQIFGEAFRDRMSLGALFTADDYIEALRMRRELCAEMAAAFLDVDLLLTAAAPFEAPLISAVGKFASYQRHAFSLPFNVTGNPALALCCGHTAAGLPLGAQLAARPFEEALLLRVGHACDRALGNRHRRPVLSPQ